MADTFGLKIGLEGEKEFKAQLKEIEQSFKVVIKGKVVVEEGGSVEGLPSAPKAENQPASEATTVVGLKEDFNALLAKLKAAGLMEEDSEEPTFIFSR